MLLFVSVRSFVEGVPTYLNRTHLYIATKQCEMIDYDLSFKYPQTVVLIVLYIYFIDYKKIMLLE